MRRRLMLLWVAGAAIALCCRAASGQELGKAEQRRLFRDGARLWPVYCAQCHNARPGSEFAPYQWDAIMMHMRTQANLPARDARAVLEYLKAAR